MFLADVSVKRPVAVSCLLIGLILLGLNSYRKMGLELLPKMDIPTVTVQTLYPGATPRDIEVDVAKRIEDAVSSVDGLKHITSSCMENICQTTLEFYVGMDVDVAAADVRAKLDAILSDFPAGVEKPVVLKFDLNAMPIATLALTGDLTVDELYDYADDVLSTRLSVISGVANVELLGGAAREVHVLLDRQALAAAGLSSLNVQQALSQGVFTLPAGRIRENGAEYSVRFDAEYPEVAEIGDLQVAGRDGKRRFIRDLGQVKLAADERRQAVFIDGRPAIGIRVVKKSDANAVKVVNAVREAVAKFAPSLPGGMELVWVTDSGDYIQASVDSTMTNILQGIVLTAIILFFFLYNLRATFIVAMTMPLTIVISLFFMEQMGFSLNMSTLLALGLSVGVLVTNSIVVMESVVSHLDHAENPWAAARHGTSEVAVPIIASAGTNMVVLLPIGMMGDVVGQFFKPFALTQLAVNLTSLFISFTLTPILCALLLRGGMRRGWLGRAEKWWSSHLDRLGAGYSALLRLATARRVYCAVILGLGGFALVQALGLAPKLGFDFVPKQDQGQVFIKLEYPTRQNLEQTVKRLQEVEALVREMPNLLHRFAMVGKVEGMAGRSSEGVYLAQIVLKFCPKTERPEHINTLLAALRQKLSGYPDGIVNVSIPGLTGGEQVPIELEVGGDSLNELEKIVLAVQQYAADVPGFAGPDTSVRAGKPELRIQPRRAVLADVGAPVQQLGNLLRANLEGLKAGVFRSGARTFDIRVKLAETEGKDQVSQFQIPGGGDSPVLLSNYASIEERRAPILITRAEKRRISKLYANLTPELSLSAAVNDLSQMMAAKHLLPAGYDYRFRGDYERMHDSSAQFLEAGMLAILLTYLALAAILESFTRPLYIMTTIPLGLIGMFLALWLVHESINIFVLLGAVMLVGIVVNNAVLVLDHMQNLVNQGQSPREALLHALQLEFRAVIMITLAAVLGMLPLALANGLGSELTVGIGVSSVGGILVSAVLTFVVMPAAILLFAAPAGPESQSSAPPPA